MGTSLTGAIGYAPQVDIDTVGTLGNTVWHKGRMVNVAVVEQLNIFDREIGGSLLPGGGYKGAYWVAGEIEIMPRLESIGWLLYTFAGRLSSSGAGATGYTHRAPGAVADNQIPDKWLTLRRVIPAEGGNAYLGEVYKSCKITQITITVAAGQVLAIRAQFQGLYLGTPIEDPYAASPIWAPSFAAFEGVPIACNGDLIFSDNAPINDVSNVTLNLSTETPPPAQELVVGQYSPRAITTLGRSIQLQMNYFWTGDALYRKMVYGAEHGVAWTPEVYTGGEYYSMVFRTGGTPFGTGNDVAGELGFRAKKIIWQAAPMAMRGGDQMMMQVTGTIVDNGSGEDWSLWLLNDTAGYTWPTAGAAPTVTTLQVEEATGATHVELTLSAACESETDPKRGFTLMVDPTGAGPNAEVTILNAYFNDSTHLHLVVDHTFVSGDTATLSYNALTGGIVQIADGVALASFTDSVVTNGIA